MVSSMTGYGQGASRSEAWVINVQMRSVNHRYCEVVVRLPRQYAGLEERIRRTVQANIFRGRVEVYVSIEPGEAKKKSLSVDRGLALAYTEALQELAAELNLPGAVDISLVAKFPDVIVLSEPEEDLDALWPEVAGALDAALLALRAMRGKEGAALSLDIAHRTAKIGQIIKIIEERSGLVVEEARERLKTRLEDLLGSVELDETRLLMEVAILADKSSITEELIRLQSHLEQIRQTLEQGNEVGRKLDFILQEINREVNTIGSKASDYTIAAAVVEVKSELEKIREQVQNLE